MILACSSMHQSLCKPMKQNQTHHVIRYIRNNQLVEETNPSFGLLRFLYAHHLGLFARMILKRHWVAHLIGRYYATLRSRNQIAPFIKRFNIDMSDFMVPTGGYQSFNDFFTRSLKAGARTIDQNHAIAPSDCKVYVIPNISTSTNFFVKHQPFNLKQFLGSDALATLFQNGTLFMFRLAPYDYHRFHFPIDCVPSQPKVIKGVLESVNPFVFYRGVQPLITNERHLITLETKQYGTVAMVPVGAMMVGAIGYTYTPNHAYKKGDETGFFAFGGSTVVLLFKQSVITPRANFIKNSLQGFETAVTMGESINE